MQGGKSYSVKYPLHVALLLATDAGGQDDNLQLSRIGIDNLVGSTHSPGCFQHRRRADCEVHHSTYHFDMLPEPQRAASAFDAYLAEHPVLVLSTYSASYHPRNIETYQERKTLPLFSIAVLD